MLKSVPLLLVGDIVERFTLMEVFQVLSKLLDAVSHELFVLLSAMGSQKHVWKRPQFTFLNERFLLEDIEDSTADHSFFESGDKVILLYGRSSANVHEHGRFLHF